jgi:hypothetical protein
VQVVLAVLYLLALAVAQLFTEWYLRVVVEVVLLIVVQRNQD